MIFENIRALREDNDLTQQQLADYLGVAQNTYSQYETGKIAYTAQVLVKLADFYGVSVDYLLYPEQPDARIRNIEALLRDKPESFIIAVERLVRLCIEEFSGLE